MKKTVFAILMSALGLDLSAQLYQDYIGAGHAEGITVTTSHSRGSSTAEHTIDGAGMDAQLFDASRFLNQATMGSTVELAEQLHSIEDYQSWIDEQMIIEYGSMKTLYDSIYQAVLDLRSAAGVPANMLPNENPRFFNYAWTQANMTTDALLRHKVAYALSQIFVISMDSKLSNTTKIIGVADYYDMLLDQSFGNFRDLLEAVAFHPTMGYYLTHLNNSRSFPEDNIFPDENFAREIMQLFTIGLHQLNQDGSLVLDAEGNAIPTYTNTDINEMAKVFTGLAAGDVAPHVTFPEEPFFGLNFNQTSVTTPMIMYDFFHEPGVKVLPDGTLIPDGLDPLEDIGLALDWLFQHPNTAPFISHKLIQRLVKSNPSPQYIQRVAAVFADNGAGVRGDLGAVIKAILLDEEARSADGQFAADAGRLKEPLMRQMNAARGLPHFVEYDRYWDTGFRWRTRLRQQPMFSETVFNFYLPDYQPSGDIGDSGLVGPEYQIHYTSSSIDYVNAAYTWGWSANLFLTGEVPFGQQHTRYDYDQLVPLARSADLLINELDRRLTHGTLTDQTRGIIREAINQYNDNQLTNKVRAATYLILMSAEYAVMH